MSANATNSLPALATVHYAQAYASLVPLFEALSHFTAIFAAVSCVVSRGSRQSEKQIILCDYRMLWSTVTDEISVQPTGATALPDSSFGGE